MEIELCRKYLYKHCTIGTIKLEGIVIYTLELPYKNNQKNISSIPEGRYELFYRNSKTNGDVFQLKNVPDRSNIQIHAGNYSIDTNGCILVGLSRFLSKSHGESVGLSKKALKYILKHKNNVSSIKITQQETESVQTNTTPDITQG